MSQAAKSVLIFGFYMMGEGLILLLIPNILLTVVNISKTEEFWIRLLGLSLAVLGYYYIKAARAEMREFFSWSVHIRFIQFGVVALLISLGIVHPVIIFFSAIEFASGIWTYYSLQAKSN